MARPSDNNRRRADRGPVRIAVVGARGAGKTTLAAGLAASATEHLSVSPDDNTTGEYLERLKTALYGGCWPKPTPVGERPDVNLRLNMGEGRTVPISFTDYMGDLLGEDESFIEDYMCTPDGAMLLFNPGMDALSDGQARSRMVSRYKKAIDHFRKCGCKHVVFVVTASDRLDGDLADRKEELAGYEREITNYLRTVGGKRWWSRIAVTVTGRLESQDRPKLATGQENTAGRPFVHLLERIKSARARHGRKKAIMRFCLAGLAAALAAGGLHVRNRVAERREAERMLREDSEIPNRLREELEGAKRLAGCIAVQRKAREWKPNPGGRQEREDILRLADEACRRFADTEWSDFEYDAKTVATDKAVGEFCANLEAWEPVLDATRERRENLLGRLPDAKTTWTTEYKVHEIKVACDRGEISPRAALSLLKGSAGVVREKGTSDDVFANNSGKLSGARLQLVDAAARSYAAKKWNPKSDDLSPGEWIDDSLESWHKSEFGQIDEYLSGDERSRIGKALGPAREAAQAAWFGRQDALARDFVARIATMSAVDACVDYGAFCSEHPKNPGLAGADGIVRRAFAEKVDKAFSDYRAHYGLEFLGPNRIYATSGDAEVRVKEAESRFEDLRKLCMLLRKNASATLGDTPYCKFALAALPELEKGQKEAFAQQLVVTDIVVSFKRDTTNIQTTGWLWTGFGLYPKIVKRHGTAKDESLSMPEEIYASDAVVNGEERACYSGRHVVVFNAWVEPGLQIDAVDRCGGNNGWTAAYISLMDFRGGQAGFERPLVFKYGGGKKIDSSCLCVTVKGEVIGRGFLDLWKECFGE